MPLYDSFGVEALHFIVENVKCSVLFVDGIDKQIQTVLKLFELLGESNPIKFLIFSDLTAQQKSSLEKISGQAKFMTCKDAIEMGEKVTTDVNTLVSKDENLERVIVIMYTSGSTGMPKGVCLKVRNVLCSGRYAAKVFSP